MQNLTLCESKTGGGGGGGGELAEVEINPPWTHTGLNNGNMVLYLSIFCLSLWLISFVYLDLLFIGSRAPLYS